MLSTDELHLLEPLDATAPLAARMFHELRRLGYKIAVGWVVRPPAEGDETIHGAHTCERLALQAAPERRLRGCSTGAATTT